MKSESNEISLVTRRIRGLMNHDYHHLGLGEELPDMILDLANFQALTVNLHLIVLPPHVYQRTVLRISHQISCFVNTR
jgi:hypothetical protein